MKNKIKLLFAPLFIIFGLLYLSTGCNRATLSKAQQIQGMGEYYNAANMYRKLYNKTNAKEKPKRAELAYEMANCYRLINYSTRAEAAYINAIRYNCKDSMAIFYLAETLRKSGKYKEAIKQYELFLSSTPNFDRAIKGIEACQLAPEWKEHPSLYIVKKTDKFNSRRGDFSPMIVPKTNDQIYITSFRDQSVGKEINGIMGTKYNDIFVITQDEKKQWTSPETIDSEINSEYDDGVCSFTSDGQTMYFTRGSLEKDKPAPSQIFTSNRSGGKWGTPTQVKIINDTITSVGHPAVSPDGSYLLFVSDMAGGLGGKDIWKYYLTGSQQGVVENIGPIINTSGDEMFPYVHENGNIYFSSDGHIGLGGLDIFKAFNIPGQGWHVENMRIPINSNADDFGITFFDKKNEGFFSSNRGDARGWDHIYSFVMPTYHMELSGMVYDKEDYPIANAIIRIIGDNGTSTKVVTKVDGTYSTLVEPGVTYLLQASAPHYLNTNEEFITELDSTKDYFYTIDFLLLGIGKPIVIENIFYDFDKAELRPESKEALNELITLLNDNPNITIELGSHTDMWGSEIYNDRLSQRRAESVINYLIENGISQERLEAMGYGKRVPSVVTKKTHDRYNFLPQDTVLTEKFIHTLTREQQDTACQINRRTEFKVLKTTYNLE